MTQQMEMVARYKQLRQVGLAFNIQLTKSLAKEDIHEGARLLGILQKGTLVLDHEDEINVLMDYCLHDVRRNGKNALERFMDTAPPPADSDEMLFLHGKLNARFSLFMAEAITPGVGVQVRDLLYDEDLFITDLGFSMSAEVGMVVAFRLMTMDGISMTTGAALAMSVIPLSGRTEFEREFVSQFKKMISPADSPARKSDFTALMIRSALKKGAASRIRYAEPNEKPQPKRRSAPPNAASRVITAKKKIVGLNDRCPCGSGRKLRNCCGSQNRR